MTENIKKGLLAIWANVDNDYRTEFQKWQNCEHISDRVTIPGFFVCRRYQGIRASADFLMCYETDDPGVLESEQYLHAVDNPTSWTKKLMAHSQIVARAIYGMVSSAGEKAPTEAPYIIVSKFDLDLDSENQFLKQYSEEHLSKMCHRQGVYSGQLYRVDEKVSHIQTTERKMHGGGPGQQRFLALYQIASLDILDSKTWGDLNRLTAYKNENMTVRTENRQDEIYWLDFVMYAPIVS